MSFNIQKDNLGRIRKKTLNNNNSIGLNNNDSLASSYSTFTTSINTLTLNNQQVNSTSTELNKTIVTPGTASSNKVLVVNSNKNISNINSLSCQDIIINGISLNSITSNQSNLYLNNINPGTATQSRALVLDSNKNISTINSVKVNNLQLQNANLEPNNLYDNNLTNYTTSEITNNANNFTSICWADSLNLFIAVSNTGTNNRVMTSPDGITWTIRTSASNNNWTSICWSSKLSLLVAISNSGTTDRIMTSPDGIIWTTRTSVNDYSWNSICWSDNLNIFVAVGYSNVIADEISIPSANSVMTSTNGINWTARSAIDYNWTSVCYSPELNLFAAVSKSGNSRVMTSPDGITWTIRTSVTNNWTSICWANELSLFVAVSNSGTNRIMTSSDGITWISRNINLYNDWCQVIWSNQFQTLIAIADNYSYFPIMISNNGINWKPISSKNINNRLSTICWSNTLKKICILSKSDDSIRYLNNFTITNASDNLNRACRTVYWSSNLNLFFITGVNKLLTSTDGNTWINITVPSLTWNSIVYSSELSLLVAVADGTSNTSSIITSTDGITWTTRTAPSSCHWITICYGGPSNGKLFVAIAQNASSTSNAIMTSTNGTTWTNRTAPGNGEWWKVIWVNELSLFICVGTSTGSRVMTSPDGISWTLRTAGAENNWKSVTWSPELNLLVAVSDTGVNQIMTSSNGINWSSYNCPYGLWYSVQWISSLNMFIAVGQHTNTNSIMYSSNGLYWNVIQNTFYDKQYRSFDWSSSLGIFVFGSITTSTPANIIKTSPNNLNTNIYSLISNYTNNSIKISNIIKNNNIKLSTIKYAITKWYNTSVPNLYNWTCICWAGNPLNRYIIGANSGANNRLYNVFDGITNSVASNTTMNINALAWSPELQRMVAVGNNTTNYNSNLLYYNGSNWASVSTPTLNNWTSVCWSYNLGMFVAVSNTGYKNRAMISYDAINWYIQETPNNNNWTSICWSDDNQLFVAVSNSGTDNRVMTSSDGLNWIARTSATNNNWTSVCWAIHLQLYIAVSNSGIGNRIMTSPDGINWTSRNSPANNNWNCIIYIEELFLLVAIASTGDQRLMYSRDGINWTLITLTVNNSWQSITWSPEYGNLMMVSSDGTNQINRSDFFKLTYLNNLQTPTLTSINNKICFGTQQLNNFTHKFEYGITSTTTLSLTNGTSINTLSQDENNLTLNSANINLNINDHNNIDSGLALNNVLITSNANQINSLSNITLGQAQNSKVLTLDNLGNIKNINNVSCNSFTLNSSLTNISPGNSSASNLLIADNNKEVSNINTLGVNNLQILNTTLTTYQKKITSNISYNLIFNKSNNMSQNNPTIREICWSNELQIFVGIANNGYSVVSSDGISWAVYLMQSAITFNSICWSPKLKIFVAISANASNIFISSNGITWSTAPIPTVANWISITWSEDLNLFAAIAQSYANNCIITSPDGMNWIFRTAFNSQWWQIIYAQNKFIAIGTIGLITSTDGITWNTGTVPASHNWKSITYSDTLDLFVIVADTGTNRIATSSDLSTWTNRTSPVANSFYRVLYAKEINTFLAVATSGTNNRIIYSNDGINWFVKQHQNVNNSYQWIAWSPSLYKFVLSSSNSYVMVSNSSLLSKYKENNNFNYEMTLDNILEKNTIPYGLGYKIVNNWINRTNPTSNTLSTICRSDDLNLFVALSNTGTGNRIITSPYGTNWTVRTNPVDNNWTSICYSSELNLFVAISNTGTSDRIMTSSDGINWTSRTNPVDNNWTSICYSPELNIFVAVANTGTNDRIMTSSDGINWTSRTNPVDNNWTSICYSPELILFVAVSNSGTDNRVMTSNDGINWTSRTSAANNNWTSVCWANNINLFIAVADSGSKRIMISNDGINWTTEVKFSNNLDNQYFINTNNWQNVIWINELNLCIAISNSGTKRLMVSNNGIHWYIQNLNILQNWKAIAWSKNLGLMSIIATNTTNSIIQSIVSYSSENTAIIAYPNQLYIDNKNKRIGLGTNSPSYQLQLSTDSAMKLSSSTWTVSSDIRLKQNIINADLDLCYNNIKNLPLKRYTWKNDIYTNDQVNDRSKLGWIADDVETIFPNAVKKIKAFGFDDCRSLNNDQIIASLYGCIQKLIQISEHKQDIINNLENQYNSLKTLIDSLEIIE
jgi:hypothetical protein